MSYWMLHWQGTMPFKNGSGLWVRSSHIDIKWQYLEAEDAFFRSDKPAIAAVHPITKVWPPQATKNNQEREQSIKPDSGNRFLMWTCKNSCPVLIGIFLCLFCNDVNQN